MKKFILLLLFLILLMVVIFYIKSQKKVVENKNVVAMVGNTPITKEMLDRELIFYQTIDPNFKITKKSMVKVLNNMINKYILIEEAKREKIDTSPEFLDKMRNYWEETLIQLLYKRVNKNFLIVVSEDEIKDFYRIKSLRIEAYVSTFFTKSDAEKNLEHFPDKNSIHYYDINSTNLPLKLKLAVAGLKSEVEPKIIEVGDKFYLVKVINISKKEIPPYEKIRNMLKSELKEIKREEKFEEWLKKLKENIKVKIYYNNLR